VQAGLPKSPRIQILLLRQCVRVSGHGAKTHTLTLSLVRERASKRSSLGNLTRQASCCNQFFRQILIRERASVSSSPTDPRLLFSCGNQFFENLLKGRESVMLALPRAAGHYTVPPSTMMVRPVTHPPASEARNVTTSATSPGCPIRPQRRIVFDRLSDNRPWRAMALWLRALRGF